MVSKAALRSKCCFKRTASYVLLLLFGESHSQATEAAPKEQQDLPFARIPLRKHAYNARKKTNFLCLDPIALLQYHAIASV